jgi:hypothetical protein
MSTINETYINALLADAAYVRLHSGTEIDGPNTALLTGSALTTAIAARLTQPQADFITSNFEVLNQELSAFGGFDAVVWRGKVGTPYAGKVYVSMRGTQGLQDIADDGSLAFAGIPHQRALGSGLAMPHSRAHFHPKFTINSSQNLHTASASSYKKNSKLQLNQNLNQP